LALWLINPFAIKKLLSTFGLTEKSLGEKKKSEDKNGDAEKFIDEPKEQ
jgi:hypothetical protein